MKSVLIIAQFYSISLIYNSVQNIYIETAIQAYR